MIQMGMDITEQKRAEAQIHEMALFPALNPDGVLQVDETKLIRKINPAAARMGFSVGAHLTEVIPGLHELDLRACIAAGTTERVYETRLGKRFLSWSVRGAPEFGLAFLYSKDITQQKATEERLRTLSRRLVEIQENERLYISRELHDEAGQLLTLLMLDLVTLETQAYQPDAVLKKVAEMEKTLQTLSENLHNVAISLRPASPPPGFGSIGISMGLGDIT
jgi:signal transduction histidine kinase